MQSIQTRINHLDIDTVLDQLDKARLDIADKGQIDSARVEYLKPRCQEMLDLAQQVWPTLKTMYELADRIGLLNHADKENGSN